MKDINKMEDVSEINTRVHRFPFHGLIAFIVILGASSTSSFRSRIVPFYERQLITRYRDVPRIERQFA